MKTPLTPAFSTPAAALLDLHELRIPIPLEAGENDPLLAPEPPAFTPLDDDLQAVAELGEQALAYITRMGLQAQPRPRMSAQDLRYLSGPLIVFDAAWGHDLPSWLRASIRTARLGLVLAGEHELASQEEALAYLVTAGLAQPLTHDWARIYLGLGAQVLGRWGRDLDLEAINAVADGDWSVGSLSASQARDLQHLCFWLRRQVSRAAGTLRAAGRGRTNGYAAIRR